MFFNYKKWREIQKKSWMDVLQNVRVLLEYSILPTTIPQPVFKLRPSNFPEISMPESSCMDILIKYILCMHVIFSVNGHICTGSVLVTVYIVFFHIHLQL